jgi:hypothetical protein
MIRRLWTGVSGPDLSEADGGRERFCDGCAYLDGHLAYEPERARKNSLTMTWFREDENGIVGRLDS